MEEKEDDGITHYDGCWNSGRRHYGCAVGEVERLVNELNKAEMRIKQARIQGIREGFDAANESRWEKVRQTGERYRLDLMRHPYPTADAYLKSKGLI